MEMVTEKIGEVSVVTLLADYLDVGNCNDFRNEMTPLLAGCNKVVLDFDKVQFVDSRGCGAIISCLKHVSAARGDLKLCCVRREVRTVFELIRLHRICEIFPTRDEAVRAFEKWVPPDSMK